MRSFLSAALSLPSSMKIVCLMPCLVIYMQTGMILVNTWVAVERPKGMHAKTKNVSSPVPHPDTGENTFFSWHRRRTCLLLCQGEEHNNPREFYDPDVWTRDGKLKLDRTWLACLLEEESPMLCLDWLTWLVPSWWAHWYGDWDLNKDASCPPLPLSWWPLIEGRCNEAVFDWWEPLLYAANPWVAPRWNPCCLWQTCCFSHICLAIFRLWMKVCNLPLWLWRSTSLVSIFLSKTGQTLGGICYLQLRLWCLCIPVAARCWMQRTSNV